MRLRTARACTSGLLGWRLLGCTHLCAALLLCPAGVELVELLMDKDNSAVNRGFAFVSFYNYACADDARKKFETAESTCVSA